MFNCSSLGRRGRWATVVSGGYVVTIGLLATVGFADESPAPILLAAALTLPCALALLPAYYAAFGLLALLPGANPPEATGYASCSADGRCVEVTTGGEAAWFSIATDVLGVTALVVAAGLNIVLWRAVASSRKTARAG